MSLIEQFTNKINNHSSISARKNAMQDLVEEIGEDAIKIIEPLVQDFETEIRIEALKILATIGNDEIGVTLIPTLEDYSWDVRAEATNTLITIAGPKTISALIQLLKTPDYDWDLEKNIIQILGHFEQENITTILIEKLTSENVFIKKVAAESLARLGHPGFGSHLLSVKSSEHEKNINNDEILGEYLASMLNKYILPKFKSKEKKDKELAIEALNNLLNEPYSHLKGASVKSQTSAVEALNKINHKFAHQIIFKILPNLTHNDLLKKLIRNLGLSKNKDAMSVLKQYVAHEQTDIRRVSVTSYSNLLKNYKDQDFSPILLALEDQEREVRQAALVSLSQFNDESLINALLKRFSQLSSLQAKMTIFQTIAAFKKHPIPDLIKTIQLLVHELEHSKNEQTSELENILKRLLESLFKVFISCTDEEKDKILGILKSLPSNANYMENYYVDLLGNGTPKIREYTLKIIEGQTDLDSMNIVYSAFNDTPSDQNKSTFFNWLLHNFPISQTISKLESILYEDSSKFRAKLLNELKSEPQLAQLYYKKMLKNPSIEVKLAAIKEINQKDLRIYKKNFTDILEKNEYFELYPELINLISYCEDSTYTPLLEIMKTQQPQLSNEVDKVISLLSDKEIEKVLQNKSNLEEGALKKLKNLLKPHHSPILIDLLWNATGKIRFEAAELLIDFEELPEEAYVALYPFISFGNYSFSKLVLNKLKNSSYKIEELALEFFNKAPPSLLGEPFPLLFETYQMLPDDKEAKHKIFNLILQYCDINQSLSGLRNVLFEEDEVLRNKLAEAILILPSLSVPTFQEMLQSSSIEVIKTALTFIKKGQLSDLLPEIENLINSEKLDVFDLIIETIGNLNTEKTAPLLNKLAAKHPEYQPLINKQLENLSKKRFETLKNKSSDISEAYLNSLKPFMISKYSPYVLPYCDSENEGIRLAAAGLLLKLDNLSKKTVEKLMPFLRYEDEELRAQIANQLTKHNITLIDAYQVALEDAKSKNLSFTPFYPVLKDMFQESDNQSQKNKVFSVITSYLPLEVLINDFEELLFSEHEEYRESLAKAVSASIDLSKTMFKKMLETPRVEIKKTAIKYIGIGQIDFFLTSFNEQITENTIEKALLPSMIEALSHFSTTTAFDILDSIEATDDKNDQLISSAKQKVINNLLQNLSEPLLIKEEDFEFIKPYLNQSHSEILISLLEHSSSNIANESLLALKEFKHLSLDEIQKLINITPLDNLELISSILDKIENLPEDDINETLHVFIETFNTTQPELISISINKLISKVTTTSNIYQLIQLAIVHLPISNILQQFSEFLYHENDSIRELIAKELIKNPHMAQKHINAMLSHESIKVKKTALKIIKDGNFSDLIPLITSLIDQEVFELYPLITNVLGEFDSTISIQLLRTIEKQQPKLKDSVAKSLDNISSKRFKVLNKKEPLSRNTWLSLLPLMQGKYIEQVIPFIHSDNEQDKHYSQKLLLSVTELPKYVLKELIHFLGNPDENDRQLLIKHLKKRKDVLNKEITSFLNQCENPRGLIDALEILEDSFSIQHKDVLLKLLVHQNSNISTLAEKGINLISEYLIKELVSILLQDDVPFNSKQRCINILANSGAQVVPQILQLYKKQQEILDKFIETILLKIGRSAIPEILNAFDNLDPKSQLSLISILGKIPDSKSLYKLVDCLGSNNSAILNKSIESLFNFEESGINALIDYISKNPGEELFKILAGQLEIDNKMFAPHILNWLQKSTNAGELKNIIMLAGISQLTDAIPIILEKGFHSNDKLLKVQAIKTLGKLKYQTIIPELVTMLKQSENYLKAAILESLGDMKSKNSLSVLMSYSDNESEEIRSLITQSISKIESQESIEFLLKKLHDPSVYVQREAVKGLSIQNDQLSRQILLENIEKTEDEDVLHLIIELILEPKDSSDALPVVTKLLGKVLDKRILSNILEAIGKYKYSQAIPEIITMINTHQNHYIIEKSIVTLGKIGNTTNKDNILGFLNHNDWNIQRATIEALSTLADKQDIAKVETFTSSSDKSVKSWILKHQALKTIEQIQQRN